MAFTHRTSKLVAGVVAAALAVMVYATSGSSHRRWSADKVPIAFWAWKTVLPEKAEFQNPRNEAGTTQVFVRAGQVDLDDGEVRRTRPAKGNLPESVEVHLVYNATRKLLRGLESVDVNKLSAAIADTYESDVKRFGSANIRGIQLDIDFPTRLLPNYEKTLRALKQKLPPKTVFSITGLPTWMSSGDLKPLLDTVDFWIPQLYGAEIPSHISLPIPISSAKDVRLSTIAAREVGKPFMAGLAAYGYAIHFDKNGELFEIRGDLDVSAVADNGSFDIVLKESVGSGAGNSRKVFRASRDVVIEGLVVATGESLVFDSPTPESLREAGRIVRQEGGNELLGICVFRLPTAGDSTNLRLREIVDALRDRPATSGVDLTASQEISALNIRVMNSGASSSFAHEALAIEIAVPAGSVRGVLSNHGFSGFETLCSQGSGMPAKCSSLRADLIRLTRNSWRPGDEASIQLNAIRNLPGLTAIVETRSDNGRIDRVEKAFTTKEVPNEK